MIVRKRNGQECRTHNGFFKVTQLRIKLSGGNLDLSKQGGLSDDLSKG